MSLLERLDKAVVHFSPRGNMHGRTSPYHREPTNDDMRQLLEDVAKRLRELGDMK